VLFDADVLCKIIKETNGEEEANSGLFILAQCAIQFNLLLSAIKIIRQLDYAHERKHLLQNITTKLYKENKVYQFLSENKDELTLDEISKIRHVKNWKIFFKLIFLVLYCLIVVIVVYVVVYVAILLKNRYGKMVMFIFLLFTILALYILLRRLWNLF
jgi:ABC-type multidrug transport system fused ATPase/permease subunit